MQNFSYERQAMQGEPIPDGLSLPEQMAYLSLRAVYKDFSAGRITAEQGRVEKGKILYTLELWKRRFEVKENLCKKSVELFKSIEIASWDYAKNRTLENADKLYYAVYKVWPG